MSVCNIFILRKLSSVVVVSLRISVNTGVNLRLIVDENEVLVGTVGEVVGFEDANVGMAVTGGVRLTSFVKELCGVVVVDVDVGVVVVDVNVSLVVVDVDVGLVVVDLCDVVVEVVLGVVVVDVGMITLVVVVGLVVVEVVVVVVVVVVGVVVVDVVVLLVMAELTIEGVIVVIRMVSFGSTTWFESVGLTSAENKDQRSFSQRRSVQNKYKYNENYVK